MKVFLIGLIACVHVVIAAVEMLFWKTPAVYENFGLTFEQAATSAPLAANQGLYNNFLAAGLVWGLLVRRSHPAVTVFFLICILMAGIFGAATVKLSILWVQAVPAAIALLWMALKRDRSNSPMPPTHLKSSRKAQSI